MLLLRHRTATGRAAGAGPGRHGRRQEGAACTRDPPNACVFGPLCVGEAVLPRLPWPWTPWEEELSTRSTAGEPPTAATSPP